MDKVFNLETVHDTAGRTMTQKIEPFTVVVDWKNETIRIMKGFRLIDSIKFSEVNFTLNDYERLITSIEESANRLRAFKSI